MNLPDFQKLLSSEIEAGKFLEENKLLFKYYCQYYGKN